MRRYLGGAEPLGRRARRAATAPTRSPASCGTRSTTRSASRRRRSSTSRYRDRPSAARRDPPAHAAGRETAARADLAARRARSRSGAAGLRRADADRARREEPVPAPHPGADVRRARAAAARPRRDRHLRGRGLRRVAADDGDRRAAGARRHRRAASSAQIVGESLRVVGRRRARRLVDASISSQIHIAPGRPIWRARCSPACPRSCSASRCWPAGCRPSARPGRPDGGAAARVSRGAVRGFAVSRFEYRRAARAFWAKDSRVCPVVRFLPAAFGASVWKAEDQAWLPHVFHTARRRLTPPNREPRIASRGLTRFTSPA